MSTLSKSPVRVARAALAVAEAMLADYAHRFSPHRFTQPQLFACLAFENLLQNGCALESVYCHNGASPHRSPLTPPAD